MPDPEAVVYVTYDSKGEENLTSGSDKIGVMGQRVNDVQTAMRNLVSSITQIANKVEQFGANSVNTFAEFDQGMSNVKSIVQGSSQEVEQLEKLAQEMGRDMPILGKEAADGFYQLASAGKSANDIMALSPQITKTAIAANTDFATTANLVTAVQDSWKLKNTQVAATTDILMNTVKSFKTTLPELAVSMQYAATTAAQMGVKVSETAAHLGNIRQAGLDASTAGSGFRNVLMKLGQATTTSNEKLAIFADSIVKNRDGSLNLTATLQNVNNVLSNTGPVERMTMLSDAFGARAAGVAAIMLENTNKIKDQSASLEQLGTVTETYNTQMEGAGNKLKVLQGQMEEQERVMGEKLLPTQIALNEAKIKFLNTLNDLPGPLGEVAVGTGMVLSKVTNLVGPLAMATSGIYGMTTAQWSLNAAMYANPYVLVAIAIIALIAVLAAFTAMVITGTDTVKRWGAALLLISGPIGWIILLVLALTGHLKFLKPVLKDVESFFIRIWNGIGDAIKKVIDNIKLNWTRLTMLITLLWEKNAMKIALIVYKIRTIFKEVFEKITDPVKKAFDKIKSIFDWLKNAPTMAREFVTKFINGLVDTIKEKAGIVAKGIEVISGLFGGSPPEWGPLKDAMVAGGPEFIRQYLDNMRKAINGPGTTYNYYSIDARSSNSFGGGQDGIDEFIDYMYEQLIERLSKLGG